MIEIFGVYKNIGDREILTNVDINIAKGSIFGLIGPNGAGKTTLIKCVMGILKPDKGSIKVKEMDVFENTEAKQLIGFVPDQSSYYGTFRVKDIINFYQLSYKNFNMDRYNQLNSVFKIPEKRFIRDLSKGMKTRFSIMMSLSIMPEILVLDEPTSGLDPIIKREVLKLILDDVAERQTTVLISSHNLGDLERICDSIAIIKDGEIKYSNSIENMKTGIRKFQVVFRDEAPKDIEKWDDIMSVSKTGRVYYIVTSKYTDSLKKKLETNGADIIDEIDLSLEDMFIYSMGGDDAYEEIF